VFIVLSTVCKIESLFALTCCGRVTFLVRPRELDKDGLFELCEFLEETQQIQT
jgi:hypothetical protein